MKNAKKNKINTHHTCILLCLYNLIYLAYKKKLLNETNKKKKTTEKNKHLAHHDYYLN